jgi:ABC-type antimicrobial peptide transport system permease subunit
MTFTIDERPTDRGEAAPVAVMTGARADAMEILGVSLRAGSWWSEGATHVAVISQTAAMRYFGGVGRAIGRHLSIQGGEKPITFQIIGVGSDIANTNRTEPAPPRVWIPMPPSTRRMTFIVESPEPAALASRIRTVAASTVPTIPIEDLQTLAEAMRRAEASDYVVIGVLAALAVVALLLATSGLFGVISFTVAQRTPEFGTRMALGAGTWDVMRLVAGQSLGLVAIGLAVGLAGGIAVGFAMGSLLFGLSPADPRTLAEIAALLTAVAALATAIPAQRAARIDPVIALRSE